MQVEMLYQWNNMIKTTSGKVLMLGQDHRLGESSS